MILQWSRFKFFTYLASYFSIRNFRKCNFFILSLVMHCSLMNIIISLASGTPSHCLTCSKIMIYCQLWRSFQVLLLFAVCIAVFKNFHFFCINKLLDLTLIPEFLLVIYGKYNSINYALIKLVGSSMKPLYLTTPTQIQKYDFKEIHHNSTIFRLSVNQQ